MHISASIQHDPRWINPPSYLDADRVHFHGSGHIFRGNCIHDILFPQPENVDSHIDCFQTFSGLRDKEPGTNVLFERNRCHTAPAISSLAVGKGFMLQGASNITIRNSLINAFVGLNGNTGTSGIKAYNPSGISFNGVPDRVIEDNIFYHMPGQIIYLKNMSGLTAGRNLEYRSDGKPLLSNTTYSHTKDLWG